MPEINLDADMLEHMRFVLRRYRNDALFEANAGNNAVKTKSLNEAAELTLKCLKALDEMEVG